MCMHMACVNRLYNLLKRTINNWLASSLAILANCFASLIKALCFHGVLVIDLIKEELVRVRDKLKTSSESELKSLSNNMLTKEYIVFGKKFPLIAWSEQDADNSIVVIVEMRNKHFLGTFTCYQ